MEENMAKKIRVSTVPLEDYTTAPSPLFMLPPDRIRKAAVVGDFVYVTFVNTNVEKYSERMWVRITKADNEAYEGTLENDPGQFSPKVLKYGDIVKFSWNNICDMQDADGQSKMHGLDSVLVYAQHIEALLKTWASCQPLKPLDDDKCRMIANHICTLTTLVLDIQDELGLKGGTYVGITFGKGVEGAVEAAEHLTEVITDWAKANPSRPEKTTEHILLFIPAANALFDTLEPSTKPTAAGLLKRLENDEKTIRPATLEQVRALHAEMGINPDCIEAKRAIAVAEQYAADLNTAMAAA
jgi:hypothetical protein